jgi:hypothetical protein
VLSALKRFLVGQPLRTSQAVHERLGKRVALAVFASDALSSVAYATEEILLVLAVAAAYAHDRGPSLPYRAFVGVLVDYINAVDAARGDDVVTVLLPEFVPTHWWQQFLHNQPIFLLKTALLYRTGIVVSSVPYHVR